jgi:hypothetical protein
MADQKISQLTELTSPLSGDTLPIVNNGETKRITVANLAVAGSSGTSGSSGSSGSSVPAWTSAGAITLTATTTSPTKGTTTSDNISYRQLGAKEWEIVMTYIQTVAGTAGSGDYLITLPNGLSFDTTLPSQQIWTGSVGSSVNNHFTYVIPSSSGTINVASAGGLALPMVYSATKFRILAPVWAFAIQPWGYNYFSVSDYPKVQLTFRFTST